jgi:hypothetical protein
MLTIVVMFSNLQIPCIWRNIYWFALLLQIGYKYNKPNSAFGMQFFVGPIKRRISSAIKINGEK